MDKKLRDRKWKNSNAVNFYYAKRLTARYIKVPYWICCCKYIHDIISDVSLEEGKFADGTK